jgi:hypothetical protein
MEKTVRASQILFALPNEGSTLDHNYFVRITEQQGVKDENKLEDTTWNLVFLGHWADGRRSSE